MKIYAVLAGVILILCTGLYFSLQTTFKARADMKATKVSLEQVIAQNKGLEAFTESLQQQVLVVHQKAGSSRQEVEHALLKEKDWSSTSAPDNVINELCSRLNCSPAQSN